MPNNVVTLNEHHIHVAHYWAAQQTKAAEDAKLNAHGGKTPRHRHWAAVTDQLGCMGELAFSLWSGLAWDPRVGKPEPGWPDFWHPRWGGIEVRTKKGGRSAMPIRPNDRPNTTVVLVTCNTMLSKWDYDNTPTPFSTRPKHFRDDDEWKSYERFKLLMKGIKTDGEGPYLCFQIQGFAKAQLARREEWRVDEDSRVQSLSTTHMVPQDELLDPRDLKLLEASP